MTVVPILEICSGLIGGSSTYANLADCGVAAMFGNDYVAFAFMALVGVALLAYLARLPREVALGFAFVLVYMFDLLAGGSQILQTTMIIIGLGIGVSIASGVLSYVKPAQ